MTDDAQQPMEPPFATLEDLEARWHTLTDAEQATATVLLDDASDLIVSQCPHWRDVRPATLLRITCAIVKRAMLGGDRAGVSQATQTAGSFTESMSYSNPDGDLYLTTMEKRSLGMRRSRIGTAEPYADGGVA